MSTTESDHTEEAKPSSPLFSLKSHRLRICLFLLLALSMGSANRMALSTSIVCMVNASTSSPIETSNISFASSSECARPGAKNNLDELAIEANLPWFPSQQSFLLSASFYGSFVTIFLSGAVIDQFSPSRILSVGLIVSALLTIIAPFLANSSYEVFVASRVIIGMAESFNIPAINMLATRWFPITEKTTLAAMYTSGIQFAAGFASLGSAAICRSTALHGWPSIYYIFGAVTVVFVCIWALFVVDNPSKSRWTSESEKAYLAETIGAPKKKPSLRTSPWRELACSMPVHSILLCSFAFGFSTSTMQAFLPTYLREHLAMPVDKIGLLTLAPFAAQVVGKTMCGPFTDYVARKGFVSLTTATKAAQSLGSFGASATLMAFAYIPTCTNPGSALPILLTYGFVYAGGVCGFFTSLLTIAPKYTGTLSALCQLFTMLACIASSSLFTTLTSMETPYKWPLVFGTASVLQAGAGVHYLFFGSTEKQPWSEGATTEKPPIWERRTIRYGLLVVQIAAVSLIASPSLHLDVHVVEFATGERIVIVSESVLARQLWASASSAIVLGNLLMIGLYLVAVCRLRVHAIREKKQLAENRQAVSLLLVAVTVVAIEALFGAFFYLSLESNCRVSTIARALLRLQTDLRVGNAIFICLSVLYCSLLLIIC